MRTFVLNTHYAEVDAHFDMHKLQNAGIYDFLTNVNYHRLAPHATPGVGRGIQIRIRQEDLQKAKEVLQVLSILCPDCQSKNMEMINPPKTLLFYLKLMVSLVTVTPAFAQKTNWKNLDCQRQFI